MFAKVREVLKKRHLDPDKVDIELEKGDFVALMIAMAMTIGPVFLGLFAIFALISYFMFT